MPPCPQATSSPKKKRAKCKGSDVTAPSGQGKKSRQATTAADAPASNSVSLQLTTNASDTLVPHCSGCSGAGTGGRNVQLEKVGTILEAPTWMTQHKGSTTMPPNVLANSLAPESYRKGHGGHAQVRSPTALANITLEIVGTIAASSNWKGKKTKTPSASNSQGPVQVTYGPSLGPGFLLHEADGHFGFDPRGNPPIIPPGTEPDLQVLNNPYIAIARSAAERHARAAPPVLGNEDVLQSVPHSQSHSMSTSTSIQPLSVTTSMHNFEELLEPSLRSVSHQPGDNIRSQGTESRDSDTSSADESDESNGDANGEPEELSWAEVGERHGAHPGFSREVKASHQVHVTSTLAPEFKFQYSCNEGDMDAEKNLASVDHSSDEDATRGPQQVDSLEVQHSHFYTPRGTQVLEGFKPDDVLDRHHNKNGCPRLPDPASLELLHDVAERKDPKSSSGKVVVKESQSAKFKGSLGGVKAVLKGGLDPRGLASARALCPLPDEALVSVLILWDQASKLFEPGQPFVFLRHVSHVIPDIYPLHKPDMARLLYDDLAMWRSDLKKSINILVPTVYHLVPPLNTPASRTHCMGSNAALQSSWILRYFCAMEWTNITAWGKHEILLTLALREAAIVFFYTGPYRIACKRLEFFSKRLPFSCLALVAAAYHCILDGLAKDSSRNSCPKFTAKDYGPIYDSKAHGRSVSWTKTHPQVSISHPFPSHPTLIHVHMDNPPPTHMGGCKRSYADM
ncbi:hypothetical protein DFH29DRAFT_1007278 [Suillus ampliporus]|nr:hypothetical protein DFH29DRAFT_1007278 [Suillus ampliporus]